MMPIDYKKYPPNWKKEIVPAVLARAENKCECCGLPNKSTVYALKLFRWDDHFGRHIQQSVWFRSFQDAQREAMGAEVKNVKVILTIAHLDHDEGNHEVQLDRLMAMCQSCHLRYDVQEKIKRMAKQKQSELFDKIEKAFS